ncbi:MAG: hypothetical protein L0191_13155, partial [Acidobacteria bacterium]|nr:hypothetical protein [Acidobacteriota bacterium]
VGARDRAVNDVHASIWCPNCRESNSPARARCWLCDASLEGLEPDVRRAVTFLGNAKSMEDLLRCIELLKGQEAFHQVFLLNHAEEKGNTSLRFTISLKYRGDAV